jgi:predicted nucleic acid-binding protein
MSDDAFFDTTILIYAVAQDDPRAATAERLLSEGGRIGVQVLNEFVAVARRKLEMSWDEIAEALGAIRALCASPSPLTADTHSSAVRIARRYGFHIYDALMVAAALETGCTTLYSEDLQHGQKIGTLTIRNPFGGARPRGK